MSYKSGSSPTFEKWLEQKSINPGNVDGDTIKNFINQCPMETFQAWFTENDTISATAEVDAQYLEEAAKQTSTDNWRKNNTPTLKRECLSDRPEYCLCYLVEKLNQLIVGIVGYPTEYNTDHNEHLEQVKCIIYECVE